LAAIATLIESCVDSEPLAARFSANRIGGVGVHGASSSISAVNEPSRVRLRVHVLFARPLLGTVGKCSTFNIQRNGGRPSGPSQINGGGGGRGVLPDFAMAVADAQLAANVNCICPAAGW
jgi:hypothetical protein